MSRRTGSVLLLLVLGTLIATGVGLLAGEERRDGNTVFDLRCENLDRSASNVVASLILDRNEVTERRLGDALFRLRRARKNCRIGWIELAQLDYQALIDGHYGRRR